MNVLTGLVVVFALLAIVFLAGTFRSIRRGRILRAGGAGLGCALSSALAFAAVLLAFTYYSYERLTAERKVAAIEFRRTGADEYQARLMIEGARDRLYVLRGDEWQMDARVVSWKPPATVLGLDPVYRLERISGRYSDIGRERSELRTVHALSEPPAMDVWTVARRFPALTPGIDAYYGSATYLPMADGARFDLSMTRDALIARPANPAARAALGEWSSR